jgi:hypothetical protein
MVIGGMAFLMMLMSNWMALDYAYYNIGSQNREYKTENAMWVQVVLSWMAAGCYI